MDLSGQKIASEDSRLLQEGAIVDYDAGSRDDAIEDSTVVRNGAPSAADREGLDAELKQFRAEQSNGTFLSASRDASKDSIGIAYYSDIVR